MAEFATIILVCLNPECPETGTEKTSIMRLTDSGQYPWVVCGVCQQDIIPNPNPPIESND